MNEILHRTQVNRLQLIYSFNRIIEKNKRGWVKDFYEHDELESYSIFFENRKDKTIINSLKGSYHLSQKSSLALTFRHY